VVSFPLEPVAADPLAPISLKLERVEGTRWSPRIQLADTGGDDLFTGTQTRAKARRRFSFDSITSGRRGGAHVVVTPKKEEALTLKLMAWPTDKRAYKGARWRLTIDRGCRDEAASNPE
jgi:hypothetical protein